VAASIERLLPTMPRREVIETSLTNRGAFIHVRDLAEAVAIANRVAPEHLELALADPDPWVEKIHHAGAIFIGHYTSESLGDYCAGPNHVLPTSRSARRCHGSTVGLTGQAVAMSPCCRSGRC